MFATPPVHAQDRGSDSSTSEASPSGVSPSNELPGEAESVQNSVATPPVIQQTTNPFRFKDVSKPAGIVLQADIAKEDSVNNTYQQRVQAWGDFDQDGWLDLYITSPAGLGQLFVNKRDGTFSLSEYTAQLQFTEAGSPIPAQRGATWVDYNNDSWPDLYLLVDGKNMLFHNLPGRGFIEVGSRIGVADAARSSAATWGDFDRDGFLDLFIANGSCPMGPCSGSNSRKTAASFFKSSRLNTKPLRDKLFRSNGFDKNNIVTFSDVSHLLPQKNSVGIGKDASFMDADQDGDLDILVTNNVANDNSMRTAKAFILWRNDGRGCSGWCWTAIEKEVAALLPKLDRNFDLNNDGRIDSASDEWGITTANSTTFAMADYDKDGWLDIVAGYSGGHHKLFHNIGAASTEYRWLNLRLVGDGNKINRDAVGAEVTITTADDVEISSVVRIGSIQGASSANILHFGLGESQVKSLHILWPDGKETSLGEDAFAYQNSTFTWQIYYPVNVIDRIGGDVISAEEGEEGEEGE